MGFRLTGLGKRGTQHDKEFNNGRDDREVPCAPICFLKNEKQRSLRRGEGEGGVGCTISATLLAGRGATTFI